MCEMLISVVSSSSLVHLNRKSTGKTTMLTTNHLRGKKGGGNITFRRAASIINIDAANEILFPFFHEWRTLPGTYTCSFRRRARQRGKLKVD